MSVGPGTSNLAPSPFLKRVAILAFCVGLLAPASHPQRVAKSHRAKQRYHTSMSLCLLPPLRLLGLGLIAVSLSHAQSEPILYPGATNAASYALQDAPGAGLAPGSLAVIVGVNLGPRVLVQAGTFPLLSELAGTSVTIGGQPAPLVYTSDRQVAAVVPSSLPTGPATLSLTYNGQTAQQQVMMIPADFGIFTLNSAGYGAAALQNVSTAAGQVTTNGLASPVTAGQAVVLYGTGLGRVDAPDDRPPGAAVARVPIEVLVEGRTVTPLYAGRSPEFPGLDQINFIVPDDVADGCYVRLAVRAGGRLSNRVTFSKKTGGSVCDHPLGLSAAVLRQLDAGQTATVGLISLRHQVLGTDSQEGAEAVFTEGNSSFVYQVVTATSSLAQLPAPTPAENACTVSVDRPASSVRSPGVRPVGVNLDAGSVLRITGPAGREQLLSRDSRGAYSAPLPPSTTVPFLQAGEWKVQGNGGSSVGPLEASMLIPDTIKWINRPQVVERSRPLEIQWSGGDAGADVAIVGIAAASPAATSDALAATWFVCRVPAGDHRFTVPVEVLRQLPETSEGALELSSEVLRTRFVAPLIRGGQADASLFRYYSVESVRAVYR